MELERAEAMGQVQRGGLFWGSCVLGRVRSSRGWCREASVMLLGSWLVTFPPSQTLRTYRVSVVPLCVSPPAAPGSLHLGFLGRGLPHPLSLGDAMARFESTSDLDESLAG